MISEPKHLRPRPIGKTFSDPYIVDKTFSDKYHYTES